MGIKATNQITIVDLSDAYSAMLTSEAYTFVGNVNGAGAGKTCVTEAVAFCGTNQCPSVNVAAKDIKCPTGISAIVENSGTSAVKITFTTTANISEACEAIIPVTVDDITINKKFSFAVAKTGATGAKGEAGVSVTNVTPYYLASASATGVKNTDTGFTTVMQTTDVTKKYLWSYQLITYSNNTTSKTDAVIISTHGATGAKGDQGVSITNVTPYYLASASATGVKNTDTGFTTVMQTTDVTKKYLWSYQLITYSNNTTSKTDAVIISTHGATGAKGDDAISLTITTSNGNMFKNNTGTTVLTAHVFKGAVEQTISDAGVVAGGLGTVKWTYDKGGTTETKAAKTLTVSAKDVLNAQTFTCELE